MQGSHTGLAELSCKKEGDEATQREHTKVVEREMSHMEKEKART